MWRRAACHKRLLIVIGDIMLVLLLAWQIIPVTDREAESKRVDMLIESYYDVSADGRHVFSFADVNDTLELSGGSVTDTAVTSKTNAAGYWVNRLRLVPSCFGNIVTTEAPKQKDVATWNSDNLHRLLFRQAIHSESKLVGLERMRNELHYYKRKHSVTDYGYNQIAAFSAIIDRQVDSLEQIVDTLHSISPKAKLTIRYVTRYTAIRSTESGRIIDKSCDIVKSLDTAFCLVKVHGHAPATSATTRLSITEGMAYVLAGKAEAKKPVAKTSQQVELRDSTGLYIGTIDKQKRYSGLGKKYYDDGAYYEGFWAEGMPDGFGFLVSPTYYLQAGTWKAGVFKGEKLTYSADRVYGIDISRHQHEKDGNTFGIDWDKLRITNLGTATDKTIIGKVDYPVSFIYIKSTEGCTVASRYFASDYAMARKKGIRVGAYHFFSTTSSGRQQALEFIRKSKFNKGDLAPVLDVEPTEAQIAKMGGSGALLNSMRQWLNTVYSKLNIRPIIYIGQTLANKYLKDAPDITGECLIWVARYGEYQPNLKLAIWQLSSDGTVRGIHGKVDINVFSGYKEQYQEFINNHTFK